MNLRHWFSLRVSREHAKAISTALSGFRTEEMRYKRFIRQGNDTSASIAKTAEIKFLSDSISTSEWV